MDGMPLLENISTSSSAIHSALIFFLSLVASNTPTWQTQTPDDASVPHAVCRLASSSQTQLATLAQVQVHVALYVFITAGIAAGVGSGVIILLLAIMIVLAVIAVVKSCIKKGKLILGSFWDN